MILDYQIRRQGGSGHPAYREIPFPNPQHGPHLFIQEISTRKLYKHVGTCPSNLNKVVVEQVEDEGLIRLVLGDKPPKPGEIIWQKDS